MNLQLETGWKSIQRDLNLIDDTNPPRNRSRYMLLFVETPEEAEEFKARVALLLKEQGCAKNIEQNIKDFSPSSPGELKTESANKLSQFCELSLEGPERRNVGALWFSKVVPPNKKEEFQTWEEPWMEFIGSLNQTRDVFKPENDRGIGLGVPLFIVAHASLKALFQGQPDFYHKRSLVVDGTICVVGDGQIAAPGARYSLIGRSPQKSQAPRQRQ